MRANGVYAPSELLKDSAGRVLRAEQAQERSRVYDCKSRMKWEWNGVGKESAGMMASVPVCWISAQLCLSAASVPFAVPATAAATASPESTLILHFDIPPQPMATALAAFTSASKVQLVYTDAAVRDLRSPGVSGDMSARTALQALIAGTPLQLVVIAEDAFALRRDESSPSLPPQPQVHGLDEDRLPGSRTVTVTGTHIHDLQPLGPKSLVLDRGYMARTGLPTVEEVVATLPQFFGGGPSEDTLLGLEALTNSGRGSALNLRGLGAGSTLVLFDGRRLATGGSEGTFVDVAGIPLWAIERIEVLPTGASALYGTDAVGGVVNLVPRWDPLINESLLRAGFASGGVQREYDLGQAIGTRWASGGAMLSVELLDRGSLGADDRDLARSDLRDHGGDNFDTINGNPGTLIDEGVRYALPVGQDGRSLTADDLVAGTEHRYDLRGTSDLLPAQRRAGAVLSVRHDLTPSMTTYLDVLAGRRSISGAAPGTRAAITVPTSNPFYVSPGGSGLPVRVAYDFEADLGRQLQEATIDQSNVAIGSQISLPRAWRADVFLSRAGEQQRQEQHGVVDFSALANALADSDPASAFNPFGDGSNTSQATLDSLRAWQRFETDSSLRSAEVKVDGPILSLPGGDAILAIGAGYRVQRFNSSNAMMSRNARSDLHSAFERHVRALFAELRLPVFGAGNARTALRRLEVSVAGRLESSSDFGSKAVPAVALLWTPTRPVSVRASWSRSYKAPNLADIDESGNGSQIALLVDPGSSTGQTESMLLWFGKNAALREETATSWTLGLEANADAIPGLVFGATYFDTDFSDRVQEIVSAFPDLADPRLAPFVDRDPTPERRADICSRSRFFGTPEQCVADPVAAIVDLRVQNIAQNRTRGLDVAARYESEARLGSFELSLSGTYLLEFSQAFASQGPRFELLDTQNNPLDLRLRVSAAWHLGSLAMFAALNYADSYRDVASEPRRRVDSWSTWDLQFKYDWSSTHDWLQGTTLALSVRNAFDEPPPFLNNRLGIGYDQENGDLTGRFIRLQLVKRW